MPTTSTSSKPCRKCGGTGYLPHFARTDAGRCWSCNKVEARPLTDDDIAYQAMLAHRASPEGRAEARAARRFRTSAAAIACAAA